MHRPIGETALPSPAANPVRTSKGRKHRAPLLDQRHSSLPAAVCCGFHSQPCLRSPGRIPVLTPAPEREHFTFQPGQGRGVALGQDQESWAWRPLPHLGWVPEWCCWRQRGQAGHKQGTEHGDREQHPQGSRGYSSASLGGQRDTHLAEG